MLKIDVAAVIAAVHSPLQFFALCIVLGFAFASLVWLKPRRSRSGDAGRLWRLPPRALEPTRLKVEDRKRRRSLADD